MHLPTNELVSGDVFKDMTDEQRRQHTAVPDEYSHAAKVALGGKDRVHISYTSGGKLSNWAADERRKAKAKIKRKAARKARRKSR